MQIQFTNLFKLAPEKKNILKKINFLIKNNNFIGGSEVKSFEKEFSKFIRSKFCVTVANGTDALYLSIKALNLKKESEVIVPVNTWISTAEAVVNAGLKVIFCDINEFDRHTRTKNVLLKDSHSCTLDGHGSSPRTTAAFSA